MGSSIARIERSVIESIGYDLFALFDFEDIKGFSVILDRIIQSNIMEEGDIIEKLLELVHIAIRHRDLTVDALTRDIDTPVDVDIAQMIKEIISKESNVTDGMVLIK